MYFIIPSDPGITLIGIRKTQLYGFGEKDGKLCVYKKSIFDSGGWKEFYVADIAVVKCECCKNGLHVATGLAITRENAEIWIAARENEFTRMFSLDVDTMKFIRYEMLEELFHEFALLNLNLCCKCLSPIIRYPDHHTDFIILVITPQKYQSNVGIFQIRVSINDSEHCLLWKIMDSFKLVHPPVSSNIFVSNNAQEVLSVKSKSQVEDARIQALSVEYEGTQIGIDMRDDDGNEWIWHEVAFCDEFCLSRQRQDNGSSILKLYGVAFFQNGNPIWYGNLLLITVPLIQIFHQLIQLNFLFHGVMLIKNIFQSHQHLKLSVIQHSLV